MLCFFPLNFSVFFYFILFFVLVSINKWNFVIVIFCYYASLSTFKENMFLIVFDFILNKIQLNIYLCTKKLRNEIYYLL